jgi:hypothetical protein
MYDLFYLIAGVWTPSEQFAAPSRRQAMKMLRRDPRFALSGELNGRFMVRRAAQ